MNGSLTDPSLDYQQPTSNLERKLFALESSSFLI